MKALQNIQNEAKQIVEQLADRQISDMKAKYNEFQKWMSLENNPVVENRYNGEAVINEFTSAHKYVYMTMFKRYKTMLKKIVFTASCFFAISILLSSD